LEAGVGARADALEKARCGRKKGLRALIAVVVRVAPLAP
jgi:hypothetical protein